VRDGRRVLETTSEGGQTRSFASASGLEGLEAALRLIDPLQRPPFADLDWLVRHFEGWVALPVLVGRARDWLCADGVNRVVAFLEPQPTLRVQVARRIEAPLSMEGELATFVIARRGQVRLEARDHDSVHAPPVFEGLTPRFGLDGAAALWRFRHFRRAGAGVSVGLTTERVDAGPFTWLRLVADEWEVDVTLVDGQPVELRRARVGSTDSFRTPWDDGLFRLTTLLRTVDRASLTEADVRALVPHLRAGRLDGAGVRRDGDTLQFTTELDPLESASHCVFTVNLRGEPAARVHTRDLDPRRVRGT
jgi:hypothetical protein